jgi:hypothetical protein
VSANKAKGTKWEVDLVKGLGGFFLGRFGLMPRRVAQEGFHDTGDLHGISPFIGQAKNWKSWEDAMREGLDGAEKQKLEAGEPFGVAFVKRVRKPVGKGYAVMTVETWARLVARLARAEELLYQLDSSGDVVGYHEDENRLDLSRPIHSS